MRHHRPVFLTIAKIVESSDVEVRFSSNTEGERLCTNDNLSTSRSLGATLL
jgi:hypothetical protein